jgi:hypothetical protein
MRPRPDAAVSVGYVDEQREVRQLFGLDGLDLFCFGCLLHALPFHSVWTTWRAGRLALR